MTQHLATKKYTGLFTSEIDNLTVDEVEFYQQKFIEAQEADSFLWQDVVSFSEEFARESGLIDPKTNQVAQSRIIEATRKMMQKSFEKENMLDTGIWVASVHEIRITYTFMLLQLRQKILDQ